MPDSISKLRDLGHLQPATIKINIKVVGIVSVHDYYNRGSIYYRLLFSTRFGYVTQWSLIFLDFLQRCGSLMFILSRDVSFLSEIPKCVFTGMYCHYCASQENIFLA